MSSYCATSQCGIDSNMLFGAQCRQPSMLTAYTPYLIGSEPSNAAPSHAAKSIVNQLTNTAKNREFTNIALSLGGDNTLAIADISAKLQVLGVGSMGAANMLSFSATVLLLSMLVAVLVIFIIATRPGKTGNARCSLSRVVLL